MAYSTVREFLPGIQINNSSVLIWLLENSNLSFGPNAMIGRMFGPSFPRGSLRLTFLCLTRGTRKSNYVRQQTVRNACGHKQWQTNAGCHFHIQPVLPLTTPTGKSAGKRKNISTLREKCMLQEPKHTSTT